MAVLTSAKNSTNSRVETASSLQNKRFVPSYGHDIDRNENTLHAKVFRASSQRVRNIGYDPIRLFVRKGD